MFCYNGCRDHYTLRRAWLAELGRVTHCLQADIPSRYVTSQLGRLSCIPPGSLNRVPASAGVRAGMSPLPGGR